jgi:hypothetical protein
MLFWGALIKSVTVSSTVAYERVWHTVVAMEELCRTASCQSRQ